MKTKTLRERVKGLENWEKIILSSTAAVLFIAAMTGKTQLFLYAMTSFAVLFFFMIQESKKNDPEEWEEPEYEEEAINDPQN